MYMAILRYLVPAGGIAVFPPELVYEKVDVALLGG
jgi:hypothetical protein